MPCRRLLPKTERRESRNRALLALFPLLALAACGSPDGGSAAPTDPAPTSTYRPVVFPSPAANPTPPAGRIVQDKVGAQHVQISLPPNFDAHRAQPYPLLVFDHSYQKDSAQMVERTTFPSLTQQQGWIAACGDLTGTAHWGDDAALAAQDALVQALLSRYDADPARIYVVGFSMGGGTALLTAIRTQAGTGGYRVAAVASSQGWSDLAQMRTVSGGQYAASIDAAYGGSLSDADAHAHSPLALAQGLVGVPTWLEHGTADQNVPPAQSQQLADRLTQLGAPPELHLYDGLGHTEDTIHAADIVAFFKGKHS